MPHIDDWVEAKKMLQAFVADIEAMQSDKPDWYEEIGREEEQGWFGPFGVGTEDQDYSGTYIQWPNLSILLQEAKELLKCEDKSVEHS